MGILQSFRWTMCCLAFFVVLASFTISTRLLKAIQFMTNENIHTSRLRNNNNKDDSQRPSDEYIAQVQRRLGTKRRPQIIDPSTIHHRIIPKQPILPPVEQWDSFGACLKIMDDNHWLVEWLAYHYHALPLRHLTVYIDPNSKTDPRPIFDRWEGRITIDVWNETYAPALPGLGRAKNAAIPGVKEHRGPQNIFIQNCMKRYKEMDWKSWVVLVDTDEFIAVNDWLRKPNVYNNGGNDIDIPSNDEPGSVMKLLKQEQLKTAKSLKETSRHNSWDSKHKNCVRMHRLQMCSAEDSGSGKEDPLLFGTKLSKSDFLTHNFKWGEQGRQVKNMVNIGDIPTDYFDKLNLLKDGNVHDPAPGQCKKLNRSSWEVGPYLARKESLFQVYHYTGTQTQRTFRNDLRGSFGNRTGTPLAEKCLGLPADDVRPWLQSFIDTMGEEEASRLLEGVGRVDQWPTYQQQQTREQ